MAQATYPTDFFRQVQSMNAATQDHWHTTGHVQTLGKVHIDILLGYARSAWPISTWVAALSTKILASSRVNDCAVPAQ